MPSELADDEVMASPFERWEAMTAPQVDALGAHCTATGKGDLETISQCVQAGKHVGLRPGRSLIAAGLLNKANYSAFLPLESAPKSGGEADGGLHGAPQLDRGSEAGRSAEPRPLNFSDIDLSIATSIDVDVLRRLRLIPYKKKDTQVLVATGEPQERVSPHDRKEIRRHLKVQPDEVTFVYVNPKMLVACIEQIDSATTAQALVGDMSGADEGRKAVENYDKLIVSTVSALGNASGQALRALLLQAIEKGASDIHIFGDRNELNNPCYMARLRVDGALSYVTDADGSVRTFTREIGNSITARIAGAGELGDDANVPRSGRFEVEMPVSHDRHDLRVEITPQRGEGWLTVIRMLGGGSHQISSIEDIFPHEETSVSRDVEGILDDMRAGGLFIVSGATGSGKSTFLAALMARLNTPDKNLISIENPIEYRIPGVRQIQVEPRSEKMGFVSAIESALRLDPDIIMIGELRSRETVEVAIQAAETGHMVFSTLHVIDACSTPRRFKNLGIRTPDLAFVLKGVLAQTLVRTRCASCLQVGLPPNECVHCGGTGMRGRCAVGEVLRVDEDIAAMINEDRSPPEIQAAADYRTKAANAGSLIAAGRTTVEAVADMLGTTASEQAEEAAAEELKRQKNPEGAAQ